MTAKIVFFPVANGDMTLIQTEAGHNILIDMNIRAAADDPDDDTPDVAEMLRRRLKRDRQGRLYVDALALSHPDKDHCSGLAKHFHLGVAADWSRQSDKIFIRELWSSPLVFRRASKRHALCDDAKAFNREARRRVRHFRDASGLVDDGDRILILGKDEGGKTDDLGQIVVSVNQEFSTINGQYDRTMTARLLGPLAKVDDDDEEVQTKNNSSTVIRFSLAGGGVDDKCRFLTGGDTEVVIWERLWDTHRHSPDWLSYDVLLVPHHCSWHSLSHDSWSDLGADAEVSKDACNALSQARGGATIVASSKPIKDDDDDPPCVRAKREYTKIVARVRGQFRCVGEHPSESLPSETEVEIDHNGPKLCVAIAAGASAQGSARVGRQPIRHGSRAP